LRQFHQTKKFFNHNEMKLFTDKGNLAALKILAACTYNDQRVEVETVSRKDYVLPKGCPPLAQLPILEVADGKYLFQSDVAVDFIFNKAGKGINKVEEIDELIEYDIIKVQPAVYPSILSLITKKNVNSTPLASIFGELEKRLGQNQYLLGNTLTSADTLFWGSLYGLLQDDKTRSSASSVIVEWFNRLSSEKAFQSAVNQIIGKQGISSCQEFLESYVPPSTAATTGKKSQQKPNKTTSATQAKTNDTAQTNEEVVKLSKEDIAKATEGWNKGADSLPKPRKYEHPILPQAGERNILITSALPYVNNVPHLGNIIGCTLSGDVYSRFCRLRNYNSLYICGTDEYGTATETKALAEGLTPQQICDKYHKIHSEVYKWFNIEFDHFGRTTTEHQTKITQEIFWKVHKNGFILEDTVDQLQCQDCKRFLADRFVEGTCPYCKYEDARGDQCDACGKLINAIELIKPRCKQCGGSPQIQTSKHLFLDLPKVESSLKNWLKKSETGGKDNWTPNARQITKSWVVEGLKPRCITRDLKWGTQVPLEGYTDKVFYVWFDAPIGYLSISANYTDKWEKWWKNPEQVNLVQFMAKDNVPFHTVVFPSSLIAANDNYVLLNDINATEYLNYEEDKFSKSRGVGVFGDQAKDTGIPADIFRFYLLFVRPESSDSAFQWADLITKNNSELLNNLGNFVNRALMFLKNSFNSTMPELKLNEEDYKLITHVDKELQEYVTHLDSIKLRDGLKFILNISRHGNQYIQANKPWVMVKGTDAEKERAGTVIGLATNVSALLCILIKPYMPAISSTLQQQLALADDKFVIPDNFVQLLPTGHVSGTPAPLFQKLEVAFGEEMKKRFAGKRPEPNEKKTAKKAAQSKTTPSQTPATTSSTPAVTADPAKIKELEEKVTKQGNLVRELKTSGADKAKITEEVQALLAVKRELALATGENPDEKPKGKKKGKKK